MNYEYAGKEFPTRFLVAGKESGCSQCKNLTNFLKYGVDGAYDKKITNITAESNPEDYDLVVAETRSMSIPIIVDIETGKHISGFSPSEVMKMFG